MLKLYSYGKINLFLNVKNKLLDGYHEIQSIMQSIELHDEIFLDSIPNDTIKIECNVESIPVDSRNTCYKAASIIKEKFNINTGVYIQLNKSIPSEAGLAGGSSNCAAIIKGLNILWNLNLSQSEMLEIGLKIGADVPFCLLGGTYLAEGIGQKLSKVENFNWNNILIVKPSFSMSTAFVYNNLNPDFYNLYSIENIYDYISVQNFNKAALSMYNTLEDVVIKFHPEVDEIKNIMKKTNAVASMMTGSGSAVFGLYENKKHMDVAFEIFSKNYPETFKTKTINKGIDVFV